MPDHPLDDPIWQSLAHRHRGFALAQGEVLRYRTRTGIAFWSLARQE